MHDIFLQNLLKTFIAIDPLSLIPLFAVMTSSLDRKKLIKLSFLVFVISLSVLTFFLIFGNKFLIFMGVSIYSFQIIGGIFLLFISFEMVFEKRTNRKQSMSDEILDDNSIKSMAVFPISIPLIAGPSVITLSVLISENLSLSFNSFYTQFLPTLIILLITSMMILFSAYILKILSKTIITVIQKIFGNRLIIN